MHPIVKTISRSWLFILGIAVGVSLMSATLKIVVFNSFDEACQMRFQECSNNPLAYCAHDCWTKQIDKDTLRRLTLAPLPILFLSLILLILHRDAKRS